MRCKKLIVLLACSASLLAHPAAINTAKAIETPARSAPAAQPFAALKAAASTMRAGEWRAWEGTRIPLLSRAEADAFGCAGVNGPAGVIDAWNGAAFDGRNMWFHGGGHADYGCNEFYRLDLWTGEFKRLNDPSRLDPNNNWLPLSGPPATHTYGGFVYHKGLGKLLIFGRVAFKPSGQGMGGNIAWSIDPHTLRGKPIHNPANGAVAAAELPNGLVLLRMTGNKAVLYDPVAERAVHDHVWNSWFDGGTPVLDAPHRRVWIVGGYSGIFSIGYDLENSKISADRHVIPPKGMPDGFKGNIGAALHTPSGKLLLWNGSRATAVFDPKSEAIEICRNAESAVAPSKGGSQGVFTKWLYIPEADVFVGYNNVIEDAWLYRPGPELTVARK